MAHVACKVFLLQDLVEFVIFNLRRHAAVAVGCNDCPNQLKIK